MKKLLIALLILPTIALADVWTTQNNAGGQIVLTDRPCIGYPKLMEMYTRMPTGETLSGCWAFYDGFIHVVYQGETNQHTYTPQAFIKQKGL